MKRVFSAIAMVFFTVWTGIAQAQATWVQIEAQPDLARAQQRAQDYAGRLQDVNGFRLSSGWYAVALGPYDEQGAIARLRFLRSQQAIPPDSFIANTSAYRQQFWPIGSTALVAPEILQPIISLDGQSAVTAQPDTQGAENADQLATAGDLAAALTQSRPVVEVPAIEPVAEPVVVPEIVPVIDPEPPEESRAQALRSEGQLSRGEKADLQVALQWFGFYNGAIDSAFGRGTRGSMTAWQQSKDYEATGVLTSRQRTELLDDYQTVLASIGIELMRDDVAGIEMQMPLAKVNFDRYEPPFAHYTPKDNSGVTVLLISQTGDEATLLGLYDIMQTLEIVPLEGTRERRNNQFTLTGENAQISSYTHAVLQDGTVKGFTLIWPAGDDPLREVTLNAMRDSFSPIEGAVLPDAYGAGKLEQSIDLISGLQIRRPMMSRSGFYIDQRGTVLTTAEAVKACSRITLDGAYDAQVVAQDAALGLALLTPVASLAPINFARFPRATPRLQSEVALAGYSFEGVLTSPTMTFGTLSDVKGLRGEPTMKRLALAATPGDAGGPVFDTTGSVMGMLLPAKDVNGKQLPDDVSFAADAASITKFLSGSGYSASPSDGNGTLSAEDLTNLAADLTVLVSCWE